MAKHKSLGSLGKSLKKRAENIDKKIFSGIRKAALAVDQTAIFATPVDTGYARSRWVVSIGEPITEVDDAVVERVEIGEDISSAISLSQGMSEIKKWKGSGSIFINNPVVYAKPLDEGSSEQAPEGMTDQAIEAGRKVLSTIKILD